MCSFDSKLCKGCFAHRTLPATDCDLCQDQCHDPVCSTHPTTDITSPASPPPSALAATDVALLRPKEASKVLPDGPLHCLNCRAKEPIPPRCHYHPGVLDTWLSCPRGKADDFQASLTYDEYRGYILYPGTEWELGSPFAPGGFVPKWSCCGALHNQPCDGYHEPHLLVLDEKRLEELAWQAFIASKRPPGVLTLKESGHLGQWRFHDDDCWCGQLGTSWCNRNHWNWDCCGSLEENSYCAGPERLKYRHHSIPKDCWCPHAPGPCQCKMCV